VGSGAGKVRAWVRVLPGRDEGRERCRRAADVARPHPDPQPPRNRGLQVAAGAGPAVAGQPGSRSAVPEGPEGAVRERLAQRAAARSAVDQLHALGSPTHPLAHRGAWRRRAGRGSSAPPLLLILSSEDDSAQLPIEDIQEYVNICRSGRQPGGWGGGLSATDPLQGGVGCIYNQPSPGGAYVIHYNVVRVLSPTKGGRINNSIRLLIIGELGAESALSCRLPCTELLAIYQLFATAQHLNTESIN
jgi:hypothetical protein